MNTSATSHNRISHQLPVRSLLISAVLALCMGMVTFSVTTWNTSSLLVWSDGIAYFLYSRSLVIDSDTDLTNEYEAIAPRYSARALESFRANMRYTPDDQRVVVPWPPGNGLVMAPFYATGYGIELLASGITGHPPDSYGIIPQIFFGIGSIVYGLIGFWATFQICSQLAGNRIAWFATISTFFAGPAVFYVFFNPSMAHASSYGLVALLTLVWLRQWQKGITPKAFAAFGLLLGILITIRYQNVVYGLLALPLIVRSFSNTRFIHLAYVLLAGLAGALVPLSLLIANSSNISGASASIAWDPRGILTISHVPIDLKSPYFLDVLFSCRHGAFHWTPVLALGTLGLVMSSARKDIGALILLLTFVTQVYLIGGLGMVDSLSDGQGSVLNWNNHWAGGTSFSMRYLTECTPFFAIGVAYLFSLASWLRSTLTPVLCLLAGWNLLLVLAYGLNTVSRSYCVTYSEMGQGVVDAMKMLLERFL